VQQHLHIPTSQTNKGPSNPQSPPPGGPPPRTPNSQLPEAGLHNGRMQSAIVTSQLLPSQHGQLLPTAHTAASALQPLLLLLPPSITPAPPTQQLLPNPPAILRVLLLPLLYPEAGNLAPVLLLD
jgi:hypothetical protein